MDQQKRVFIGNLGFDTTIETVVEIFTQFGEIEDSYKPFKKGYAFLTFKTEEQAQAAVDKGTGLEIEGREVKVNLARPREERPRTGGGGFGGGRNFGGGGNSRGGGYGQNRGGGRDRY